VITGRQSGSATISNISGAPEQTRPAYRFTIVSHQEPRTRPSRSTEGGSEVPQWMSATSRAMHDAADFQNVFVHTAGRPAPDGTRGAVIASPRIRAARGPRTGSAKQSWAAKRSSDRDCFVASLLATTRPSFWSVPPDSSRVRSAVLREGVCPFELGIPREVAIRCADRGAMFERDCGEDRVHDQRAGSLSVAHQTAQDVRMPNEIRPRERGLEPGSACRVLRRLRMIGIQQQLRVHEDHR